MGDGGSSTCGCPPGSSKSADAPGGNPTCKPDSGNNTLGIILGLLCAFVFAAFIAGLVLCCMRSGGTTRIVRRVIYKPEPKPTEFIDVHPTYVMNVQPASFPSRGNIYGGTLGIAHGGYAAPQNIYTNYAGPSMGNNSYMMVKSTIPRD